MSSSSEILVESGLSVPWALQHAVYLLCDHRCGCSKTNAQYSSSTIAAISHRDSSLLLSIVSSDIWIWFSRWAVLLGFQSLSLLHGNAVCTEYIKFSIHLPLPFCPHRLVICLRQEIRCVCKPTEGLCYGNASCINLHSFTVCCHCLYRGNRTHSCQKAEVLTVHCVCQHIQTQTKKKSDFPALQYVCSHLWTLAQLPTHSLFSYVNVGDLKVKLRYVIV